MRRNVWRRIVSAALAAAMIVTMLPNIPGRNVQAAEPKAGATEISDFETLVAATAYSKTSVGAGATYVLTDDIEITEADYEKLSADELPVTFGSESDDRPFTGTFDGQGHIISGLKYEEVATKPLADTGLFSYTKGATIKNLTIKNADIEADMRGGIVVGYADSTTIENVTVEESSLAVRAADNVLLIGTDLGVRGGGIAGEMVNGSVAYNCEVNNCFIRTNNTAAVAALAGKDLYLGGIAGVADNSVIEYCRVIGDSPYGEDAVEGQTKTRISIYYDVAVGAVGGNALYVGGIAGDIKNGTKIIDSFSTADLYYYCATYVSVLGVNVGHIGGITGGIGTDDCQITRCHFAGKTDSYQYNALLVIPIIQNDVNISGVADYFRQTVSHNNTIRDNINGVFFRENLNPEVDMDSLRDLTGLSISPNGQYGPWSDTRYTNRSAWEEFDYDFSGTTDRSTEYNNGEIHHNKWVMDYELGIPVHGSSVAATFDFPGAGEVSIEGTDLVSKTVSTKDPYTFAVQGAASSDKEITFTYTPANGGYKLDGWWRIPDITTESAVRDHSYFEKLFEQYKTISDVPIVDGEDTENVNNPVSTPENADDNSYTPSNETGKLVQWEDNDLFVARIKALVEFHDISGDAIDKTSGSDSEVTDDDWYFYNETLPSVTPVDKPDSETAVLIGWTTDNSNLSKLDGISSADLNALKDAGTFYETGDPITEPLELYPVYSDYISNVMIEFEGYDRDIDGTENDNANKAIREGVGRTNARLTDDNTLQLTVEPWEGDAFPDGYEFLGWYVYSDNSDSDPTADYCVGREMTLELSGIDLTQQQTFVARFTYRVDYYEWCQFKDGNNESEYNTSKIYAQIAHTYGEEFQAIEGLDFFREKFSHWSNISHTEGDAFSGPIYAPLKVYSRNEKDGGGDEHDYDVDVRNDFPGAGSIDADVGTNATRIDFEINTNVGYEFVGWSWESDRLEDQKYAGTSINEGAYIISTRRYVFMGHYTANLYFHDAKGNRISFTEGTEKDHITRRYSQKATDAENAYQYSYILHPDDKITEFIHTGAAAPTNEAMALSGFDGSDEYIFLGWVDRNSIDDEEAAYIWNHEEEDPNCKYLTDSPEKAAPYIINDLSTVTVTETMDFYPVYAKYDYELTTSFEEIGFRGNDEVNAPKLPVKTSLTPINGGYEAQLTFTVDNSTSVEKDNPESSKYIVTSVTYENLTTGETGVVEPTSEGGDSYNFTIAAGNRYVFVANYEPVPVVYHLSADATKVELRNTGEALGQSPDPENTAEQVGASSVFLGWTLSRPADGASFHKVAVPDDAPELMRSNMAVTEPMELWPVYAEVSVNVQSNIDSVSGVSPGDIRGIRVDDPNRQTAVIWAKESVQSDGGNYAFVGWYTGYQSDSEPGEKLTGSPEAVLSDNALFSGVTYTAVYEKVYTVTYHDHEGSEIYTAYAFQRNPRSFVEEIQKPGAEGGDLIEAIIDTEAFTKIAEVLPENEQFIEWQWVQDGQEPQRWNEFYNENITRNMDLYPVTNSIEVKDTAGNLLSCKDTDDKPKDVSIGIDRDEETKDMIVSVLLQTEYTQPYIKAAVSEKAYNGTDDPTVTQLEEQTVSLYVAHSAPDVGGSLDDVSLYDTKETERQADTPGGILARFDLFGSLKLTKKMAEGSRADEGEVFIFDVQLGDETKSIPVKTGETVTLTGVPYGTSYTVSEDGSWSWRDEASVQQGPGEAADDYMMSNYRDGDKFTVTNTRTNNKWSDSSAYASNQFGENGITANPDESKKQD